MEIRWGKKAGFVYVWTQNSFDDRRKARERRIAKKKRASPPGVEPGIFWFQPRSGYEIVARRLDHWAMRNEAVELIY